MGNGLGKMFEEGDHVILFSPAPDLTRNDMLRFLVHIFGRMFVDQDGKPIEIEDDGEGMIMALSLLERIGLYLKPEVALKIPSDLQKHLRIHHRTKGNLGPLIENKEIL